MLVLPTLLLALTAQTASAANTVREEGNVGLGLQGGSRMVSGFSLKYFLDNDLALEGTLGSFRYGGFGISGAVLFEMPPLAEDEDFDVAWNLGPAVAFGTYHYGGFDSYSYNVVAITAVLGLEMDLNDIPLDIVLEWRPGLYVPFATEDFDDGAQVWFDGIGLAVRYYL
jgi:hypothetical protein